MAQAAPRGDNGADSRPANPGAVERCPAASAASSRISLTTASGDSASGCASNGSSTEDLAPPWRPLPPRVKLDDEKRDWRHGSPDGPDQHPPPRQQPPLAVRASVASLDLTSLQLQNNLQFRFLDPDDIGELHVRKSENDFFFLDARPYRCTSGDKLKAVGYDILVLEDAIFGVKF